MLVFRGVVTSDSRKGCGSILASFSATLRDEDNAAPLFFFYNGYQESDGSGARKKKQQPGKPSALFLSQKLLVFGGKVA